MSMNRRSFLTGGMAGILGVSFRSMLLGVPASFLLNRAVYSGAVNPKFTIFAGSAAGEPANVNGPGAYPVDGNDLANRIVHPDPGEVNTNITDVINGMPVDATDLANSVDLSLGNQTVKSARAYQALDQGFLDHLVSFWHQSGANAHTEFGSVLKAHGALKGRDGSSVEQLSTVIAEENSAVLGVLSNKPMILAGRPASGQYTAAGVALNTYTPTLMRLLVSQSRLPLSVNEFDLVYNYTLNSLYKDLKQNGTPKQKKFLDQSLLSRNQARSLGESLIDLLQDIDNSQIGQMKAAVALIKLKVSPVIIVQHDFGRDNHTDRTLGVETRETFEALKAFSLYWDLLGEHGLTDSVLYANMNVFGRTLKRNVNGGRDHFGLFTHSFLHGVHLNGGIIGGMTAHEDVVKASGINSETGRQENANISEGETLMAFHASVLAAAGVPEERIRVRIPDGKVVSAIYS